MLVVDYPTATIICYMYATASYLKCYLFYYIHAALHYQSTVCMLLYSHLVEFPCCGNTNLNPNPNPYPNPHPYPYPYPYPYSNPNHNHNHNPNPNLTLNT